MAIVKFQANGSAPRYGRVHAGMVQPLRETSLVEALSETATADGDALAWADVQLLAPLDDAKKILCVALNYVDHAKESVQPVPATPLLFFKSRESIIAPFEDITAPSIVTQLDYEGELAIVIGRAAFNISTDVAWDYVAGVTCFNDISSRDLLRVTAGQTVHLDWFSAKSLNRSTPIGPQVVATREVLDSLKSKQVRIRTLVNEEVRQDASIADMIFDIPSIIAFASSRVELSPGDIIATGTPPGVGFATGRYLSKGDRVRVEITGLAPLENVVG